MRLFAICMIAFTIGASANGFSQKQAVTLNLHQCDVNTLFQEIWKQTGLRFVYNEKDLANFSRIDVKAQNQMVEELLEKVFQHSSVKCEFEDNIIFIVPRTSQDDNLARKITVKGRVTDEEKLPLPGVTVVLKIAGTATTIGASTNEKGEYELSWTAQNNVSLVFTFIGMERQEVPYSNQQVINIVLKEERKELEEVVVTGYFERSKVSFTGAEVSVKGEELRKVGSLNMAQAIALFDPSVRTIPNNEYGSDPNRIPEITIRGENGFDLRGSADDSRTNPNAPLYILDGIEVSATAIYDMDMNRVESFTILKDASATALYGSRGANGVIVVNTVRPREGEIKVSFNANYNISVPDLRDYDLMNAAEKLEYERLAKVYTSRTNSKEEQMALDITYNERLAEVVRGVDTYWLAKPLRTSVNQRYNLFVEGGDGSFRYGIDLRYDNDLGVMKGSGREKYGIRVLFNYQFNRKFIAYNELSIDDVKGSNSPYGSFDNFAKQNPYERIYDAKTGEMVRRFTSNSLKNPLLDIDLPNKDLNKYTEIRDNFSLDWRITPHFRMNGRVALTKKILKDERYRSAESSEFDMETDPNKKGSYTIANSTELGLDGNITASYNNTFREKFLVSMGVGSNMTTSQLTGEGFTATGFLNDNMNYIQYAQGFKENSKPTGIYDKARMVGFFGTLNLGYANRYFIEGSFRTDGSSRFGRDSRFAPFWAVGFAWNLNQEAFWNSESYMKVRASVGSTGTTNFSADQALTKYEYNDKSEYNGTYGAILRAYGNPALKWQNTLQYNVGTDLTIWRNIITLNVDAYLKQTQNLLLPIDVAPSTGFASYIENMGSMENKGIDARLRINLINDRKRDLNWNVTLSISHNKNKIKDLSNALEAMNAEALTLENSSGSKPLRVYEVGRSQSALMVVRSMGIDPRTGNEIFVKLNGDLTFEYDAKDKVVVGDLNPDIQGSLQTNVNYKGFNLFMAFGYEYGAKAYNETLATKVEGSDPLYNADKRVLYDRWKQPGDIAMFRRIDDTSKPYQSTRLVQDNNYLSLQNLSLSYEFPREKLSFLYIERCKLIFSTTDVFRLSSIKQERGTRYPFARAFSFGLNVTF